MRERADQKISFDAIGNLWINTPTSNRKILPLPNTKHNNKFNCFMVVTDKHQFTIGLSSIECERASRYLHKYGTYQPRDYELQMVEQWKKKAETKKREDVPILAELAFANH